MARDWNQVKTEVHERGLTDHVRVAAEKDRVTEMDVVDVDVERSAWLAHVTALRPKNSSGGTWPQRWDSDAAIYRLDPPLRFTIRVHTVAGDTDGGIGDTGDAVSTREAETEYVLVSATLSPAGPEAMVFPADRMGRQLRDADGGLEELGVERGSRSHRRALANAGYLVAGPSGEGKWQSVGSAW